ncbi:MAG TPA: chemotaxis protein CheA [Thermoanaerobaculia bacterium]|nr:chemotaxis protein CheA [Thermoanaerobaculia bacterium]
MSKEDERARQEFTSEAEELLDALSKDLSEFESLGQNVRPEVINKIFREVHSLKGLAGMLGFVEIAELSHNLEDMLDRLRMGKVEITRDLHDVLYDSVDSLNRLVISINDPEVASLVDLKKMTTRIHQLTSSQPQRAAVDDLSDIAIDEQTRKSLTEYEEHRLRENIRSGNRIFSIEVTFDFADFDERLRHVSGVLNGAGEVVSTLPAIDPSGGTGISFRLLYGTKLEQAAIESLSGSEARVVSLRKSPLSEAQTEGPLEEEVSLRSLSRTVRVDIGRLDHVMNIVGELIIEKTHLESLISQMQTRGAATQDLTKVARNLDRKLNDLQKSVIEIRMVPVGQIYSKLSRTVRKVARELGKEIDLILRGEDTELDKMMVEELTDPLMHVIRNALDHGIEPADERIAGGKPGNGLITLTAYQKGSSVVIDVSDDGRGIDPDHVRRAAVRKGLIGPQEPVDTARACELLFTPGFSTAETVSEISGRGVGLDVVKKNIQELKGSIDVITERGKGTTFRIMLPITLAILQALIVRSAGEAFAIPLTSVEESLRIRSSDIGTIERKEVFTLRDFTLPLLRLSDAFGLTETRDTSSPDTKWFVVVTRVGERLVGILVDGLVRQQEIVIKSIGERLKTIPGIAGATEIGENEIILVVDVGSLIDRFGGSARDSRRGVELSTH